MDFERRNLEPETLDPAPDNALSSYLAKLSEIRTSAPGESGQKQARNYRGPEFQKMTVALCQQGIAVPVLWTDWSVDRKEEGSAGSLGIRSFEAFERVLVDEYGHGDHIHKGPGDGSFMADLRASGSPLTQKGIGNALYFLLETTMQQFLNDRGRKDPHFLKFLYFVGQALRVELAKRRDAGIGDVNAVGAVSVHPPQAVDINDIFELLANPESWIAGFLKSGRQFLVGGEFDQDTLANLGPEVFELFQMYLGKLSPKEIRVRLNLDRLRRKKLYGHELQKLNAERRRILRNGEDKSAPEKQRRLGELDRKIEDLEDKIFAIRLTHRELGKMESHSQISDFPLSPHHFFGKSFSTKFTREIEREYITRRERHPERAKAERKLDLRQHIQVAPEGFVQGDFDDMPQRFEPESALAITGVRSDSHQDHRAFAEGIRNNIALLKPGGVILTDGIRQSYSRIFRLEEIRDVICADGELMSDVKVEIVFDPQTQQVRSLLIQKQHPEKGFLTPECKRSMFADDMRFLTIHRALENPFVVIGSDVRRMIETQTGKSAVKDGRDAFRDVQDTIDAELGKILRECGIGVVRLCAKESPVVDEIRRTVMRACFPSSVNGAVSTKSAA